MSTTAANKDKQLRTTGQVAKALGVALHKVEYVIDTFDVPTYRVGYWRAYDDAGVEQIRAAIAGIDGRRRAAGQGRREPAPA
jgi:hypothetical protein